MKMKKYWTIALLGVLVPVGLWAVLPGKEPALIFEQAGHGDGGLSGNEGDDAPFSVAQFSNVENVFERPTNVPAPDAQEGLDTPVRPGLFPPVAQPADPIAELRQAPAVASAPQEGVTAPTAAENEALRPMVRPQDSVPERPQIQAQATPEPAQEVMQPRLRPVVEPETVVAPVTEEPVQDAAPVVASEPVAEPGPPAAVDEDPEVVAFAWAIPQIVSINEAYKASLDAARATGDQGQVDQVTQALALEIRQAIAGIGGLTFERYIELARLMRDDPAFSQRVLALIP